MAENLEISSVTGVDLRLNVAGPGARAYAFVIDWHIRLLLALAWFVVGTLAVTGTLTLVGSDEPAYTAYMLGVLVPALALYLLYHPVLEAVMGGRTPGKRIAGVRIVDRSGQRPTLLAVFIRNVLRLVDSLPSAYMLGLLVTVLTRDSVRIGDLAAGTLLVYDGDERDRAQALMVDPEAVRRHGLARAELAAELLERWDTLEPGRREKMGARLLEQLGEPVPDDPARIRVALQAALSAEGTNRV